MRKMWITGIKSGVITVLGLIAYGLIVPSLGLQPSLWGGLEYVVLALGIYSAHYYYRAANEGRMTYVQGLRLGLIVSAFTGLVNGFIIYLYTKSADPLAIERLTETLQKVLQARNTDPLMTEKVVQLMQETTPRLLWLGTLVSTVLLGFAITLVVAAFARSSSKTGQKSN